jgi:citrate lyase beta subunit
MWRPVKTGRFAPLESLAVKIFEIVALSASGHSLSRSSLPAVDLRAAELIDDLDSIVRSGADRLLLSDCRGPTDLQKCDVLLSVTEARAGRPDGTISIVASAADSAAGLLKLQSLGAKSRRLAGLTWNRTGFCADLGCAPDSAVAEQARIQVVIAARAAGVEAYDSVAGEPSQEQVQQIAGFGFSGYAIGIGDK